MQATLIRVHTFHPAKDAAKGGPGAVPVANCSPDGPTVAGDTALTGWKSPGGVARRVGDLRDPVVGSVFGGAVGEVLVGDPVGVGVRFEPEQRQRRLPGLVLAHALPPV